MKIALRALAVLLAMLLLFPIAARWIGSVSSAYNSPEYQAACHGPPLGNVGHRDQALTGGFEIDRRFDCITKSSHAAVQEANAKWAAANTPEAKAQRQAEWAAQAERGRVERQVEMERRARDEREASELRASIVANPPPLRILDVNTAGESELVEVIGVTPETAAEMVAQRKKALFRDWADLVNRVVGISAAQNAAMASTGGLTVNGRSLDGAPPNAVLTALEKERARGAR